MAKRPPALSPEALAALTAYRDATTMPDAARERGHTRLSEGETTPASRPAWVWIGVGALAAGLLLWGAFGIGDALKASTDTAERHQAPMQAPHDSGETASIEPGPAPEPAKRERTTPPASTPLPPVPLEEIESAAEPGVEAEPPVSAPPRARPHRKPRPVSQVPAEPPAPSSRLGAENRLIARTWEQVRAKQYAKARQTLAEHATEFPSGVLAPERKALLIIVGCLQHPESATGKADAYAATGRNTLLTKVRSACSKEKSGPK